MEYKCPYCNQDSYSKSSKKIGKFESWKAVARHTSNCSKSTKEYHISIDYGPIHYTEFCDQLGKSVKNKYPKLKNLMDIKKVFKRNNIQLNYVINWNSESILKSIQKFYIKFNRIPTARETKRSSILPEVWTVTKYFGSWNKAIKAAGFEPIYSDTFGNPTKAKDTILYRSHAEAYFVDNFLYGKYKYEYERKYDNHNKWYDFYLPELNLYIELDGELRPEVIKEKIAINKQENKNLIVIKTKDIYNKKELNEFGPIQGSLVLGTGGAVK